jgi:alpha-L-fucosidase
MPISKTKHLILCLALASAATPVIYAQKFPIEIPATVNFDGPESFPLRHWVTLGDYTEAAGLSKEVVKSGKSSLEVKSGGSVEAYLKLVPNSTYKLSVWMKTSSGSDEVQVNMTGLAENNISVASALADWTLIEKEFNTSDGQQRGIIEFKNPANPDHNSSWIDDLKIERMGDYTPEKPSGIKPLPPRKVVEHLGLTSQPDEKLKWLLDAKFGMFLHGVFTPEPESRNGRCTN